MELISSAFRTAFRDYCSDKLTLSLIGNIFDNTGMQRGEISPERLDKFNGQRRTLVEEYYASIDWASRRDVQKFLKALSNFLRLYAREEDNYIRELLQEEGLTIEGNIVSFTYNKVSLGTGIKNLIFAANGPKPEIVLIDALNMDVKIVRNHEYCLVYDKPISEHGLLWKDLQDWWREEYNQDYPMYFLCNRLRESLGSDPERLLLETYLYDFSADEMPALIPQVYLHYDPYTSKQLSNGKRLPRQRMDFLMLLPNNVRIVLEVDGKQHYSKEDQEGRYIATPELYAEMVAEDRRLKLAGYEIYRFGGYELYETKGKDILLEFFRELFQRHSVEIVSNDLE
jgi:very-short-patch-repair endonuclease